MSGPVVMYEGAGLPVTEQEEAAAKAAVRDMLGPDQELVSVEKNVVVKEEEVIIYNLSI